MWPLLVAGAWAGVHSVTFEIPRPAGAPLPVRATFSDTAERMPVIVFSHGMGGSRDAYRPLVEAWAQAGYLVLQPTHPDSLAFAPVSERLAARRDPGAFVRDPQNLAAWDDRALEVRLTLDHLDDLAALGLDLARVDRERVGVGGHSFGAHTTLVCGGLEVLGVGHPEPRADALLVLSPPGPSAATAEAAYRGITRPALVVTGSEDRSPGTGQGPEWRLKVWENLGAEPRWLLFVEGMDHGLGGIAGREDAMGRQVIEATTRFWDAMLREDPAAREVLDRTLTRPAR